MSVPDALGLLLREAASLGATLRLTADGTIEPRGFTTPAAMLLLGQLKARRGELRDRLWSEVVPEKCGGCKAWVLLPDPGSAGFCDRTDCPYRRHE